MSTELDAEERVRHGARVAMEVVHRPLEIGDLQPAEEAQRGVPQAGHDPRAVPGPALVAALLTDRGYHLQANRKRLEGAQHPERDAQFQHIATQTTAWQQVGVPVISVDLVQETCITARLTHPRSRGSAHATHTLRF